MRNNGASTTTNKGVRVVIVSRSPSSHLDLVLQQGLQRPEEGLADARDLDRAAVWRELQRAVPSPVERCEVGFGRAERARDGELAALARDGDARRHFDGRDVEQSRCCCSPGGRRGSRCSSSERRSSPAARRGRGCCSGSGDDRHFLPSSSSSILRSRKKIKPPNSKNEENEKRKTHALSFNQRLSLLPRPRIQRMLSPPAACSGSSRSVRACPLARIGTSAAAQKQQQQAALPLCRLRSLKTMPPNKPTAAGASAANAAAAASNGGPPSAEGGSKKSQDDHTAADYYFDSYSHFGKKRGREREKG